MYLSTPPIPTKNSANTDTYIFKFTMEIWKPSDEKKRKVNEMITVLGGNSTPYLDTDLFFNNNG